VLRGDLSAEEINCTVSIIKTEATHRGFRPSGTATNHPKPQAEPVDRQSSKTGQECPIQSRGPSHVLLLPQ
jgi:hypothetical protein